MINTLTPSQVAEIFGKSPITVRKWIRDGLLPALKFNNRYYIRKVEVLKLMLSFAEDAGVELDDLFCPEHIELFREWLV